MLTQKQKSVLDWIADFHLSYARQPTLMEIGEGLGLSSSSTIHKHIKQLITKGYLTESLSKAAYEFTPKLSTGTLPFLGVIAAGKPIEAVPDTQSIELLLDFCQPGRYVLRVAGDSMIEAGILDGDYVIIREQSTAEIGQIVVALTTDSVNGAEATLKSFYPKNSQIIELRPANALMESIYCCMDSLTLQGVMVGLFRDYQH